MDRRILSAAISRHINKHILAGGPDSLFTTASCSLQSLKDIQVK